MLDRSTTHLQEVIEDASKLISAHFKKPVNFSQVIQLSEPDRRNVILRLIVENPSTDLPKSIILKQNVAEINPFDMDAGETEIEKLSRFAHDWAGLEFLTEIASEHAPRFYAGSLEHTFILIEDLGLSHASFAGPLTRLYSIENAQEAKNALLAYVRCMGKMQVATFGKYQQFSAILKRIYPEAQRFHLLTDEDVLEMICQFKLLIKNDAIELGREIQDVFEFSKFHGDFHVLLHGDICSDNIYYQNNEIKLIDFEFGDYGNALIDGVYLRMNMPICWCSKTNPQLILREMETVYREELKKGLSAARDDAAFNKQLVYSCAYWLIRTISSVDIKREWALDTDDEGEHKETNLQSRILSRLDSFIECCKSTELLPELCAASSQLLSYLKKL